MKPIDFVFMSGAILLTLSSCTSQELGEPQGTQTQFLNGSAEPPQKINSARSINRSQKAGNAGALATNSQDARSVVLGNVSSGGMNSTNATTFANNVKQLEIGKSTKEDAIVKVGSPFGKGQAGNGELWTYSLYTGAMPAQSYLAFNKAGILIWIQVMKFEMSGGAISSRIVYEQGSRP